MTTEVQQLKRCLVCKVAKPFSEFNSHQHCEFGLHPRCKVCRKALDVLRRTPEYITLKNIKARCSNPAHPDFPNYGGRGITVCEEWRTRLCGYANFLKSVGLRPSPKHQLDRTNNDGNYEPGNVRWVLPIVNIRNRRSTRRLTCNGETKTLAEWAEQAGVNIDRIAKRVALGWTPEQAVYGKFPFQNVNGAD